MTSKNQQIAKLHLPLCTIKVNILPTKKAKISFILLYLQENASIIILNVLHNTLLQNVSDKGHFDVSRDPEHQRHNALNTEVQDSVDKSNSSVFAYCQS